jgi:hypothetical protein
MLNTGPPCKDKLTEGNSKDAGFCIVLRAQQSLPPAIEECNKYDLTCAFLFDWPLIMIAPGGLLLVVSYLFAVLVLWVELEKK